MYILKEDPMLNNSFFILLTSISTSGIGFLFWVTASRLYTPEEVGIVTSIFSLVALFVSITKFGFDLSIIRFFPEFDKSKVFSTSIYMSSFSIFILGLLALLTVELWSPELIIIRTFKTIFLLLLVSQSFIALSQFAMVGIRKAKQNFFLSLFLSMRLIFLFPLVILGVLGIVVSFLIANIVGSVFIIISLYAYEIKFSKIDFNYIKDVYNYSLSNYIATILISAPNSIIMLIILSMLGAESAAVFFVINLFATLAITVPQSFCTSIFVEGSHGKGLKKNMIKASLFVFPLLMTFLIFSILFGGLLLNLFSENYTDGANLLVLMLISTFPNTIFQFYVSIERVRKELMNVIITASVVIGSIIGLAILLIPFFGLDGIGYSWILSYSIGCILVLIFSIKMLFFTKK